MKTNKKAIGTQRRMMEKKVHPWLPLRAERPPPSGWLKAIRGSLGLSARQLASILGIDSAAIIRLEEREPEGKITLKVLDRAAKAMGCKVVYAIVPDGPYENLDMIVNQRARKVARDLIQKVEHSMRLENQGSASVNADIENLAQELKMKMDPRMWGLPKLIKRKKESTE